MITAFKLPHLPWSQQLPWSQRLNSFSFPDHWITLAFKLFQLPW